MLKKSIYTILFISWVVVITMLSLFSFSEMDLDTGSLNVPYADKIVHFTFYMVFGVAGSLSLRERTMGNLGLRKTLLIVLVFLLIILDCLRILKLNMFGIIIPQINLQLI